MEELLYVVIVGIWSNPDLVCLYFILNLAKSENITTLLLMSREDLFLRTRVLCHHSPSSKNSPVSTGKAKNITLSVTQ